jgi:hypothetical protein
MYLGTGPLFHATAGGWDLENKLEGCRNTGPSLFHATGWRLKFGGQVGPIMLGRSP